MERWVPGFYPEQLANGMRDQEIQTVEVAGVIKGKW